MCMPRTVPRARSAPSADGGDDGRERCMDMVPGTIHQWMSGGSWHQRTSDLQLRGMICGSALGQRATVPAHKRRGADDRRWGGRGE